MNSYRYSTQLLYTLVQCSQLDTHFLKSVLDAAFQCSDSTSDAIHMIAQDNRPLRLKFEVLINLA